MLSKRTYSAPRHARVCFPAEDGAKRSRAGQKLRYTTMGAVSHARHHAACRGLVSISGLTTPVCSRRNVGVAEDAEKYLTVLQTRILVIVDSQPLPRPLEVLDVVHPPCGGPNNALISLVWPG